MSAADARLLTAKIEHRSTVIADADEIEREWRRYCTEQRPRYLGALLGLTRYERAVVRHLGWWPRWRMRPDRVAALLTVLTTESTREIATTMLDDELRHTGRSSRGV